MKHTTDINEIRQQISEALKIYVKSDQTTIQKFCKEHGFNTGNMYSFLGGKRKGFKTAKMQRLCEIIGLRFVYGLEAKQPDQPEQPDQEAPPMTRQLEEIQNRREILKLIEYEYNQRSERERLELVKAIIDKIRDQHKSIEVKRAFDQLSFAILNTIL